MSKLIGDDELLVVEVEAYSGNVSSIYYLIGGLIERGRIEEAKRHADVLARKGFPDANAALGEHLYLYAEYPSAVAELNDDQRFQKYLDLTAPYAKSERSGAAVAAFDIGDELDNRERHTEALPWFFRAAERGHEEAAIALGYAYVEGLGVAVNILEGVRWFMRSLEMEPGDAASDSGSWPVNREQGWWDSEFLGDLAKQLDEDEQKTLIELVGSFVPPDRA